MSTKRIIFSYFVKNLFAIFFAVFLLIFKSKFYGKLLFYFMASLSAYILIEFIVECIMKKRKFSFFEIIFVAVIMGVTWFWHNGIFIVIGLFYILLCIGGFSDCKGIGDFGHVFPIILTIVAGGFLFASYWVKSDWIYITMSVLFLLGKIITISGQLLKKI